MKQQWKLSALMAVVLLVSACSGPETVIEETSEIQVPLALETMKSDLVERTYVAVGEVMPASQVDLYISGGGYIEEIMVEAGDQVEEGLLLVRLDGSEMDMTNYNATESQLRTIRDNLGSQLTSSEENYQKQEALFQSGLITSLELDQSRLQIESLEREYANAQSAYRNQLAIIRDGLEDVSDSRLIESNGAGTVAAVYAVEGQQASGQLGLTIIDDSQLYVETYVSGEMKKTLALGDLVRLKLDGSDDKVIIGWVTEVQRLPDPTSKLFQVDIGFDQSAGWIIGDYAEVEFIVEQYEALMIPSSSVVRKGDERFIYTHSENGLAQVKVEVGRSKGSWLEVINIEYPQEVVVRGQEQLTSVDNAYVIVD